MRSESRISVTERREASAGDQAGPDVARPGTGTTVLAVLALGLLAVCLRPAATSLGPVLAEVEQAFGLQGWQSGMLTALPGVAFVIFGAVSFTVLRRIGLFWALASSAAAIGAGLLLRVLGDSWWSFAGFTLLALAGMAMGNVVLPVFAKARFPDRQALSVTIFMVGLGCGAALPALLTAPVAEHTESWRTGLGMWALLPVAAVVAWTVLRRVDAIPSGRAPSGRAPSERVAGADDGTPRPAAGRIVRSRGAWWLTAFFGLQSLHAYVHFGWVAQIYRDAGIDPVTAGLLVAIILAGGIPGGFIAPQIVVRGWHVRTVLCGYALLAAAGYTGLLLAPTTLPWLWSVCLAVGGFCFPSALALITTRTRSPEVTARTSGFVQSTGYILAALGPLAVGVVLERTGSWTMPLIGLIVLSLLMGVASLGAASPRSIDDELDQAPDGEPGAGWKNEIHGGIDRERV